MSNLNSEEQDFYYSNRFIFDQAIEHARQKVLGGWDSNRQRHDFIDAFENYVWKNLPQVDNNDGKKV